MKLCNTCRFWKEWTDESYNGEKGDCRANTPIVAGTSEQGYTCWPATKNIDWCGKHQPV